MWFGKPLSVIKREYYSRKVVLLCGYQQKMRVSGEMTVIMVPALKAVYTRIQMDKEKICVNVKRKKRWKFQVLQFSREKSLKAGFVISLTTFLCIGNTLVAYDEWWGGGGHPSIPTRLRPGVERNKSILFRSL